MRPKPIYDLRKMGIGDRRTKNGIEKEVFGRFLICKRRMPNGECGIANEVLLNGGKAITHSHDQNFVTVLMGKRIRMLLGAFMIMMVVFILLVCLVVVVITDPVCMRDRDFRDCIERRKWARRQNTDEVSEKDK